jgi:putative heme-binding domain-containing protein
MFLRCLGFFAIWTATLIAADTSAAGGDGQTDRIAIMVEALGRMDPEQVKSTPQLKAALDKALEATRGTPAFVDLVRKFELKDQAPALLVMAVDNPNNSAGVEAMRVVLHSGDPELVPRALKGTNAAEVFPIIEVLGNTGDRLVTSYLEPIVRDAQSDLSVRKQAVRSLARVREGAADLLRMARTSELPDSLKLTASTALNNVRWRELRKEAAELLPLPKVQNAEPLPPVSELVKRRGDAGRGAAVFSRETVGCNKCHQVNGKGVDFGPNLSEIGTKLGRDALFESILDPSAGISFGYEAWQVELKDGDEMLGLIVSETADEIAVKAQTGIITRYKRTDVARREKQSLSIMPTGLQQAMTTQELVDLVEYLASLKTAVK